MDDNELKPLRDPKIAGAIVGFLSFGLGVGVGYILGRRQRKFIQAVPAVDWSLTDLAAVPDEEEPELPEEVIATVDNGRSFIEKTLENEPKELERQTIFSDVDDEWNYEEELAKRTEQDPYVLHRDEFFTNEREYSQSTLTYYEGDNILVDEENTPIYNHSTIIGPMKFGHGSGDQNSFYIRNDKLHAEYEIIRDQGLYSVEVLGMEMEENARVTDLQHSGDRKFRQD